VLDPDAGPVAKGTLCGQAVKVNQEKVNAGEGQQGCLTGNGPLSLRSAHLKQRRADGP
jgi:hypothetical protein